MNSDGGNSGGGSEWAALAVLGRPRGNKGEVTAMSLSSKPDRFASLTTVRLSHDDSDYAVERVWDHQGTLVFKFRGVDSISAAEKLRGAEVLVPLAERAPLEAGEFYLDDLVGCEVRDRVSGRLIGKVTGWEEYGGPAVLEVDDGRILIPFVAAICPDVRPDARQIRVDLPEGLESINSPAVS